MRQMSQNLEDHGKAEEHRKFEIIVNARPRAWNEDKISYSQVVDLAYPPPHKDTEFFTVQYTHGPKESPQGTLVEGQSVNVKGGMRFNVARTDRS
jgi:hypothetical protein